MTHPVAQQLDSIHAMLAAGHRNLRVERHSLVLWGVAGGILFLISDHLFTDERFPDVATRAVAWLLFLSTVLGGVGVSDWLLMRRAKQARDEAWSFIHRQVMKIWWLFMALAILFTFAMFFYGGGYMVYTVWLVALGLGLYVHGLFSEELLEWVGGLIIAMGVACLAAQLAGEYMKWIAAATFGIGMPLLAAMLDRGHHRPTARRLLQALLWLIVVLVPPALAAQYTAHVPAPDGPAVKLDAFRRSGAPAGTHAIELPAGTVIPVEIDVGGTIFRAAPKPVLELTLAHPLELLMTDGKLTGDARRAGDAWVPARHSRWISIPRIDAELTPEHGPVVHSRLIVRFQTDPEN
jgi:hypothetical protein